MNLLTRFRVRAQIGVGFFIGVLLLATVAGVAFGRMNVMRTRAGEAAALSGISTLTRDVMAQMLDESAAVRGYIATGDTGYLRTLTHAQRALQADLFTLDHADQTTAIDSERLEQIDIESSQIETDIAAVRGHFNRQVRLGRANRSINAAEMRKTENGFERLRRDDDALLGYTTLQAKAASAQFEQAQVVLATLLVASTAGAVFILILTALLIGGSISRRLFAVTQALIDVTEHDVAGLTAAFERLSSGDLSATFTSDRSFIVDDGGDEIATLAQSYNGVAAGLGLISIGFSKMTQTLRDVMNGIVSTADDLADLGTQMSSAASESSIAVDRIAASMESVALGARNQAERITQARAEIGRLGENAGTIAAGAATQARGASEAVAAVKLLDREISALAELGSELAGAARHAQEQAAGGEVAVAQTALAMMRIDEATRIAAAAMKNLESSTGAVSEIVSAIGDIADQTNLLSLNAAIEAARAGEHGRGFAVVADEVRKLAAKSRTSTGEIAQILQTIQRESVRAAEAIESAFQQVMGGSSLANDATAALDALGAAIAQTSRIAVQAATRSEDMHAASSALTSSISNVQAVIDDNEVSAKNVNDQSSAVLRTIGPVALSAETQATAARDVSDATGVLSEQLQEMNDASQASRQKSAQLRGLLATFNGIGPARRKGGALQIAAILALAVGIFHPAPAKATTEFARRTLMSCGACHTAGPALTTFGKVFKASGYRVPRSVLGATMPVTLQAQTQYTGDPDDTGLPKLIVDKVIALTGGTFGGHFTYDGQQYVMDGGVPGDLREAWVEYVSSWSNRIPIAIRAGQQVLPLPADPQRFKLSQQDYALFVQTVGDNPFNLYEPMNGVRASFGKEVRGLNISVGAFSSHDQGVPGSPSGVDWMFAAHETFKRADIEAYRYEGGRTISGSDRFWRQGLGANAYVGRFTLNALVQTGNDSDPLGLRQSIASSGGYVQGVYQIGRSTFAYAREDGVNDSAGNFTRQLVLGSSIFVGRSLKVQLEDTVVHAPHTHNAISLILGFGASSIQAGAASY